MNSKEVLKKHADARFKQAERASDRQRAMTEYETQVLPPAYPAATLGNTGDGIRMAQELGASLWHMWHFHGVYGFHHPDPDYRLGIRVRRLRNWAPGIQSRQDNKMSWILVDRGGRRFIPSLG